MSAQHICGWTTPSGLPIKRSECAACVAEQAADDFVTCPQCRCAASISELFAFRGMDRLRSTLSCGHVVAREQIDPRGAGYDNL